jgi:hypothetical protein
MTRFRARRRTLATIAGLAGRVRAAAPVARGSPDDAIHMRAIPASGERIPAIGLGTWITFDVGESTASRASLVPVMRDFAAAGGRVVDSSPMYGSSEAVIGDLAEQLGRPPMFAATKIWTPGRWAGAQQVERSLRLWGLERLDLVQVHNLLDWRTPPAHPRGAQARGAHPLPRRHDLARPPTRRARADHARDDARLRAVHVQPRRSRCRAAPFAARARPWHRR